MNKTLALAFFLAVSILTEGGNFWSNLL